MGYKVVKLSDISTNGGCYGIAASAVPYSENLPTYLRITDINDDGTINFDGLKSVADQNAAKYYLAPNDIVFARTGASTGRNYFYDGTDGNFVYAGFLIKFSVDPKKVNPMYVKYYCQSKDYYDWVSSFNTGSTRGNINAQTLGNMPIPLPPRKQQDTLVDTLHALDAKITNNKAINHHLEQMAQAIFKSWFVDFEPFGGEMPDDRREGTLGEIIELFDFKRVPLSSNQRDKMAKIFPYYGAATLMDYVDDYLFDGIYLLLGEDGTVIDDLGFPTLQYVWGKFWVNNHAHILQGRNGFTVESLYVLLKQTSVTSIVTGAVQPKINQANLKALGVLIPEADTMKQFNALIDPLFAQIRKNHDGNLRLATLRDTLLPRLMSGELSVTDLGDAK